MRNNESVTTSDDKVILDLCEIFDYQVPCWFLTVSSYIHLTYVHAYQGPRCRGCGHAVITHLLFFKEITYTATTTTTTTTCGGLCEKNDTTIVHSYKLLLFLLLYRRNNYITTKDTYEQKLFHVRTVTIKINYEYQRKNTAHA